jgi:hypothetical protein
VKLHQLNAIIGSIRSQDQTIWDKAQAALRNQKAMTGRSRVYTPKDDGEDKLPAEYQKVQLVAADVTELAARAHAVQLDAELTQDTANTQARADLVVEGVTIASDVPVSALLRLEARLVTVASFVRAIPVQDQSEDWAWDANRRAYASAPVTTVKTKKVPRASVLVDPTQFHRAEIREWAEDVLTGTWETTELTGTMPEAARQEIIRRVGALTVAVKAAREAANTIDVTDRKIGTAIFDYLLSRD